MQSEVELHPWERLSELVEAGDANALQQFLESLTPSQAVYAISHLGSDIQQKILTTLTPAEAAELVEDVPDAHAVDMIERLASSDAASILNEMDSNAQADLLGDLDKEDAEAILAEMDPEQAEGARRLIEYESDVAGGLMFTEFLSFPRGALVRDVAEDLSASAEEYEDYDIQYLYVVSPAGRLVGVIRLRDLVLSPRDTPVKDIMIKSPMSVPVDMPLDELAELFERYELLSLPVVDKTKRMVGVVLESDVDDALIDRADSDHLKSQGIVGGEELRTMPVFTRSRRRLSWLSINIVLNIIAASVIAVYQDTLAAVIALAVFLPIVSDMSGCSGNQAVAVSMRELSLGLVKPLDAFRVWAHEVSVGLTNGAVLGVLLGTVAWLWQDNVYLGLVVGGALALNTVVAVSIGGTVPLLLRGLKLDPALASGPILTTVTDMCGFFLILSFATLMLPLLTVT